jgi:RNA polymerase sigma-70 factor, ECF subfamily
MWHQVYLTDNGSFLPAQAGWKRMDRDLELIQSRNPDPQNLALIHDHLYPVVYRYVRYRLEDEQVCEDIASEVFLRLIDAVKNRNHSIKNLRGWLLGTASHLVNDHLRMNYTRPVEALEEHHAQVDPSPEEVAEASWQQRQVRSALQRLTLEQQHVIALRFSEERSLEETARLMDKTVGAVKTLQFRALTALRQILGGQKKR